MCCLYICVAALVTLLTVTSSASTPTLRVPGRAVPVYEDTATPGLPKDYYPMCLLSAFQTRSTPASSECAAKTSYDWFGSYLPTASERRELCSCTMLINQLQTVVVPRCTLYRGGEFMSYANFVAYAFGLCSVGGSSSSTSSTTTTPTTTAPPFDSTTTAPRSTTTTAPSDSTTSTPSRTTSPRSTPAPTPRTQFEFTTTAPRTSSSPTYTNNNDNNADDSVSIDVKSKKAKSKAPLIGGIIGGLVACALIVFGAFRYGKKRGRDSDSERGDGAAPVDDTHTIVQAMPLSPLQGNSVSSSFHYAATVTSPKAGDGYLNTSSTEKTF